MTQPRVAVSGVVDAPPDVVYAILADYKTAHGQILPKPYFASMVVEQGGQGAGTVIHVTMRVFGLEQTMRLTVMEPEPGRVLAEEDPEAGVRTTFTVTPLESGTRSQVEIATVWRSKSGLTGWLEGLINPAVARHIYRRELKLLAEYAPRKNDS